MQSWLALLALVAGGAAAHGGEDHSPPPAPAPAATVSAQRLADGSLFVPKAVQHQLGLRTVVAKLADHGATVELNGRVIADANAGGRVQASQAGRIEPAAQGLPLLGRRVVRGEVLAWLRPIANAIERGNQQAQFAELEAQLAIAERKAARYAELEGALPAKEIEAARLELAAWRRRHEAVKASLSGREALVAPVSGVIAASAVVAGQVVEAKDTLFEIVDPRRLAVEALAYDPALVEGIEGASLPLAAGSLELRFLGGGRQLREQALPLLFRIESAQAPLAVGQPVKLIARKAGRLRAVAVPKAALSRNGAGETVVWLHAEAERFLARQVLAQPLDGTTVLIREGLKGGERVVSEGASRLAQVR